MKTNPPTRHDAPLVAQMAKIGLVPGKDYDSSKISTVDRELLKAVPKAAVVDMRVHLKRQKTTHGALVTAFFEERETCTTV